MNGRGEAGSCCSAVVAAAGKVIEASSPEDGLCSRTAYVDVVTAVQRGAR